MQLSPPPVTAATISTSGDGGNNTSEAESREPNAVLRALQKVELERLESKRLQLYKDISDVDAKGEEAVINMQNSVQQYFFWCSICAVSGLSLSSLPCAYGVIMMCALWSMFTIGLIMEIVGALSKIGRLDMWIQKVNSRRDEFNKEVHDFAKSFLVRQIPGDGAGAGAGAGATVHPAVHPPVVVGREAPRRWYSWLSKLVVFGHQRLNQTDSTEFTPSPAISASSVPITTSLAPSAAMSDFLARTFFTLPVVSFDSHPISGTSVACNIISNSMAVSTSSTTSASLGLTNVSSALPQVSADSASSAPITTHPAPMTSASLTVTHAAHIVSASKSIEAPSSTHVEVIPRTSTAFSFVSDSVAVLDSSSITSSSTTSTCLGLTYARSALPQISADTLSTIIASSRGECGNSSRQLEGVSDTSGASSSSTASSATTMALSGALPQVSTHTSSAITASTGGACSNTCTQLEGVSDTSGASSSSTASSASTMALSGALPQVSTHTSTTSASTGGASSSFRATITAILALSGIEEDTHERLVILMEDSITPKYRQRFRRSLVYITACSFICFCCFVVVAYHNFCGVSSPPSSPCICDMNCNCSCSCIGRIKLMMQKASADM